MTDLHGAAAQGFQSGAVTYARSRPGYGKQAGDWLTTDLALAAGKTEVTYPYETVAYRCTKIG